MKVEHLSIPEVLVITPKRIEDSRGFFSETYNAHHLQKAGVYHTFVQDNQSFSTEKNIIRGLHCQLAPHEQGKLVRCSQGAIWDVAVDARTGSPTFGKWVAAELSQENWSQLWIPPGFLHGFCTLSSNVMVQYKCTKFYNKASERAVCWDCEDLAIDWPIEAERVMLSEKDNNHPNFSVVDNWFRYLA